MRGYFGHQFDRECEQFIYATYLTHDQAESMVYDLINAGELSECEVYDIKARKHNGRTVYSIITAY